MAYHPFYSSFSSPPPSTIPPPSPNPYVYGYSSHYNHEQQPPLPYSQPQPPPPSSPTPNFSHGYTPPSLDQPSSNPYTPLANLYSPLASLYSQSHPPPPSSPPPLYLPPLPFRSTDTPPPNPIEPVSSCQNSRSYVGSASYSNTYYNPPDYYQNSNVYGTPATVWNHYSNFSSHPYTNSFPDSNSSCSSYAANLPPTQPPESDTFTGRNGLLRAPELSFAQSLAMSPHSTTHSSAPPPKPPDRGLTTLLSPPLPYHPTDTPPPNTIKAAIEDPPEVVDVTVAERQFDKTDNTMGHSFGLSQPQPLLVSGTTHKPVSVVFSSSPSSTLPISCLPTSGLCNGHSFKNGDAYTVVPLVDTNPYDPGPLIQQPQDKISVPPPPLPKPLDLNLERDDSTMPPPPPAAPQRVFVDPSAPSIEQREREKHNIPVVSLTNPSGHLPSSAPEASCNSKSRPLITSMIRVSPVFLCDSQKNRSPFDQQSVPFNAPHSRDVSFNSHAFSAVSFSKTHVSPCVASNVPAAPKALNQPSDQQHLSKFRSQPFRESTIHVHHSPPTTALHVSQSILLNSIILLHTPSFFCVIWRQPFVKSKPTIIPILSSKPWSCSVRALIAPILYQSSPHVRPVSQNAQTNFGGSFSFNDEDAVLFKHWDPGKFIQWSNFYNLEDKVGFHGVWNVRNNNMG